MNKKKKKTIAVSISIISVFFIVGLLLFCFNYFFHRTVKIESNIDISEVTWYSRKDAIYHTVTSNKFNHMASYGEFIYEFNIDVDGLIVPVEISVFKSNSKKHDNVKIIILQTENEASLLVSVYQNRNERYKDTFDVGENNNIQINIGP